MENIDKSSGINVILSLFTGVTDKSDNEKKEKELSKHSLGNWLNDCFMADISA